MAFIQLEELASWAALLQHLPKAGGPIHSGRIRIKTKLYQSQEEELKEKEQQRRRREQAGGAATERREGAGNTGHGSEADSEEEEESHNWMEGARLGEARNPGPVAQHQQPFIFHTPPAWNHAPGQSTNFVKAPAGWRGIWAVPQAPAGEFAKGIDPGPKASSAGVGPVPHRNTGCNRNSVNMIPPSMSRAGTAQHTTLYIPCTLGNAFPGAKGSATCRGWHGHTHEHTRHLYVLSQMQLPFRPHKWVHS